MHDVCARPGQFHVGRGEAEAFGIFAQVGEQARLLAFELEAQAHDGVHVAHGFLAVRVDRDGPVGPRPRAGGVRGAHRLTFTPSLVSSSTLSGRRGCGQQSPRISRFLPLKAFRSCPQT